MQEESIRSVNSNGQISIGKRYAGKTFSLVEIADGILQLKEGTFIPKNEEWLVDPKVANDLKRAIRWSETHERQETDLDELERRLLSVDER